MKMPLLAFIAFLLFAGCYGLFKGNTVKDFIPGTYTSAWTNEFSEAKDTILIEVQASTGSETYRITRRTHFIYQQKPEYKLVHWVGIYKSDDKTVIVNNNGRVLSFDPVKNEMKMGATTYKKL